MAIGIAVGVNEIDNSIVASIDNSQTSSVGDTSVLAQSRATIDALVFSGAGTLSQSAGVTAAAIVAQNTVTNVVEAYVRDTHSDDSQGVTAGGTVRVRAEDTLSRIRSENGAGTVSISEGASAAVSVVYAENQIENRIWAYVENSTVDANAVNVEAVSAADIDAFAIAVAVAGSTDGISFSGGGAAITNTIKNSVYAFVGGDDSRIAATDWVLISADDSAEVSSEAAAASVALGRSAGVSVGVSLTDINITNTVQAFVAGNVDHASGVISDDDGKADITGCEIQILASSDTSADAMSLATSVAVGGSVAGAGAGAVAKSKVRGKVTAFIGSLGTANTSGNVIVDARSTRTSTAKSLTPALAAAKDFAFVIGVSIAESSIGTGDLLDRDTQAYLRGTVQSAGSLHVLAVDDSQAESDAFASASGIALVGAAGVGVNSEAIVATTVGAQILGGTVGDSSNNQNIDVIVRASGIMDARAEANGIKIAANIVGASIGQSSSTARLVPSLRSAIDAGSNIFARNIFVESRFNVDDFGAPLLNLDDRELGSVAKSSASGGGTLDLFGAVANATTGAEVETFVDHDANLFASADVHIESFANNFAKSRGDGFTVAGVGLGQTIVDANAIGNTTTEMNGTLADARNVTVQSHARNLADAGGSLAGGGLVTATGASIDADVNATTQASLGDDARIEGISGNLDVGSYSIIDAVSDGSGRTFNLALGIGVTRVETKVSNRNQAFFGQNVIVSVDGDVTVVSDSNHFAESMATGGKGSIFVDIAAAESKTNVSDVTTTCIDAFDPFGDDGVCVAGGTTTEITAGGSILLDAVTNIDANADAAVSNGSGFVADADSLAVTKVQQSDDVPNRTETTIGGASLKADSVRVLARANSIKSRADANAKSGSTVALADAKTNSTVNSSAKVTINNGATIVGIDLVELNANHEALELISTPSAYGKGVGGDTDIRLIGNLITPTSVESRQANITTKNLLVEANVPATPKLNISGNRGGALIDTGSSSRSHLFKYDRTIVFDSTVLLAGASPQVEIDAAGVVTQLVDMPAPEIDLATNTIRLKDIVNTDNLGGTATFTIDELSRDNENNTASISGTPTFRFSNSFGGVAITNHSALDLEVNNIQTQLKVPTQASDLQLRERIQIDVPDTDDYCVNSPFVDCIRVVDDGSDVEIRNTGAADVVLAGVINVPDTGSGSVSIVAEHGDIHSAGANRGLIAAREVELLAPDGSIGIRQNDRVHLDLLSFYPTLTAKAAGDIFIKEESGDLLARELHSTGGQVDLQVHGSILPAPNFDLPFPYFDTEAIAIDAPTITLNSLTGSIGTATQPLQFDATDGLTATAPKDIYLIDARNGVRVRNLNSTTGNISLTVTDTNNPDDDLLLASDAVIRADQGSVTLRVGDDVLLETGSRITANSTIEIAADYGGADNGRGANVDVRGAFDAASLVITGGEHADTISFQSNSKTKTLANGLVKTILVDTTIRGGLGHDRIYIGSNATPTANVGGQLSSIAARLLIDGGTDADNDDTDTVILDASGAISLVGTLTENATTGFGLGMGVEYTNIEALNLNLGRGSDSINVIGTNAGTTTTIDAGDGNDHFLIHDANHTLNQIAGLLEIRGSLGVDTVSLEDSGDSSANRGRLTSTRITGLGMGSTDQTALNQLAGIRYLDIEDLAIHLGSRTDDFLVTGVALNTDTAIDVAPGDEHVFRVEANELDIDGKLTIDGGFSSTLSIIPTASSSETDFYLKRLGPFTGEFSSANMPSRILSSGMNLVEITLPEADHRVDHHITVENFVVQTPVVIHGSGGFDALRIDRSSLTRAINGSLTDGAAAGVGILEGLTGSMLSFDSFEAIDILLGSKGDQLSIDTGLQGVAISIDGAAGNDTITVGRFGSPLNISGGEGVDTVVAQINAFPVSTQFAPSKGLAFNVEELVVDNSLNDLQPVHWFHNDGTLRASLSPAVPPPA